MRIRRPNGLGQRGCCRVVCVDVLPTPIPAWYWYNRAKGESGVGRKSAPGAKLIWSNLILAHHAIRHEIAHKGQNRESILDATIFQKCNKDTVIRHKDAATRLGPAYQKINILHLEKRKATSGGWNQGMPLMVTSVPCRMCLFMT